MRKFTRDDIARAYNTFELPLGTAFDEVMVKYRKLAPDLHPDRILDPLQKKKGEEKLKKLNHAKDVLKDHFKGPNASHVAGDNCACRPAKSANSQNAQPKSGASPEETARKAAEEAKRKAAAEGAQETARKETERKEAEAKAAAKKAFEEALSKAAVEAERRAAERAAQEALKKAAEEAAFRAAEAKRQAEEAERQAAAAARAATMASAMAQGDMAYTLYKQSTVDRWWCAKACAATFIGIICVTAFGDLIKGDSHKAQIAQTPAAKTQTASETKEQEETFYAKEKDRLAYDAAHRYDSEVDEFLNQISAEQKQIHNAQADIDRLRQEPDTDNNANAIRRLQGDIYTSSLYWKQTCDRLDSLVRQHPEIACDRISNRPAPPVVEPPGSPTTRPRWAPVQNQNITQDTEKTRRGLI